MPFVVEPIPELTFVAVAGRRHIKSCFAIQVIPEVLAPGGVRHERGLYFKLHSHDDVPLVARALFGWILALTLFCGYAIK